MSPFIARTAVLTLIAVQLAGCNRTEEPGYNQTLAPGVKLHGELVHIIRPAQGAIVTDASDSTVAEIFELYNTRVGDDASLRIVRVLHRSESTYVVTPEQQLTHKEYLLLGPVSYIVDLDSRTVVGADRD